MLPRLAHPANCCCHTATASCTHGSPQPHAERRFYLGSALPCPRRRKCRSAGRCRRFQNRNLKILGRGECAGNCLGGVEAQMLARPSACFAGILFEDHNLAWTTHASGHGPYRALAGCSASTGYVWRATRFAAASWSDLTVAVPQSLRWLDFRRAAR